MGFTTQTNKDAYATELKIQRSEPKLLILELTRSNCIRCKSDL